MIKFIMAAESKQLYLIYFQEANIYKYSVSEKQSNFCQKICNDLFGEI